MADLEKNSPGVMKSFLDDSKTSQPQESRGARNCRLFKQVVIVMSVCLSFMNIGMMGAWPNPALADLRETNTTIYGTPIFLTPTQEDMLGSVVSAGSILGTWMGGVVVGFFGRRRSVMMILLPNVVGWGLVSLAVSPAMMLTGRFINGMSCGLTTISGCTYIVELPDVNMRGAMSVLPTLFIIIGFIVDVASGFVMRWFHIPVLSIGISTLCLVFMFFLPESPSYLIVKGKEDEARKLLLSLRSPNENVEEELEILRDKNCNVKQVSFFRAIRQPAIAKSVVVVVTVFFIHNFCGLTYFIVNTTRIFYSSGINMDERVATLLVFLVQLIGVTLSVFLLDRIGRRVCLIFSLVIGAFCLVVFGAYLFCKQAEESLIEATSNGSTFAGSNVTFVETIDLTVDSILTATTSPALYKSSGWTEEHTWIPVACLIVFMLASSVGIMPVPYVLASEYFPTAVRPQMSSVCVLMSSSFNMAALSLFTPLQSALTPAGLMWFCSAVNVFGIVFCFAFVRETMGEHVG